MQICAVLAAVTEVIRSQGGKETETEYFAALVSKCEVGVGVQSNTSRLAREDSCCGGGAASIGKSASVLWGSGRVGGIYCFRPVRQKSTAL